jgi:uncharacterized protein with PIN domain|tara:strand:+ start:661 stop:1146 length:486 start_codon:yes stop_codon:yes gene_type:complete
MKNKFVADGMLGSLARKLRIFGYDTIYETDLNNDKILDIAQTDDRIILTSNRKFHQNATKQMVNCILLIEENDYERLCNVLDGKRKEELRLSPKDTRCSICNGEMNQVTKNEISNLVPEEVLKYQEEYYRCTSCGKIYWIGGHWQRIYALSEKIIKKIQQT